MVVIQGEDENIQDEEQETGEKNAEKTSRRDEKENKKEKRRGEALTIRRGRTEGRVRDSASQLAIHDLTQVIDI